MSRPRAASTSAAASRRAGLFASVKFHRATKSTGRPGTLSGSVGGTVLRGERAGAERVPGGSARVSRPRRWADRRSPLGSGRRAVQAGAGSGDPRTAGGAGSGDPRTAQAEEGSAGATRQTRHPTQNTKSKADHRRTSTPLLRTRYVPSGYIGWNDYAG